MKSFRWKTGASKDEGKEKTKEGQQKSAKREEKHEAGKSSVQGKEKNFPLKKDAKQQTKRAERPNTTRGAQSAVKPGNNSGFTNKKGNPEVQFGPLLREFLSSREMVGKGVNVEYDQDLDQYTIVVSFKKVMPNGVSTSEPVSLSFEEYLAKRKDLLKVKDESSHFIDFTSKLLSRLGIDVTKVKPSVSFKSVENFILKHLSPVERAILALSDEDFDKIDTTKIADLMKPTILVIDDVYGTFNARSVALVKLVNTEGPVADIEPPNWVARGVGAISKSALLDALRIVHAPSLTQEQTQTLEAMKRSLFGEDPSEGGEDTKSGD